MLEEIYLIPFNKLELIHIIVSPTLIRGVAILYKIIPDSIAVYSSILLPNSSVVEPTTSPFLIESPAC